MMEYADSNRECAFSNLGLSGCLTDGKCNFLGNGRPHGVAPTNRLEINEDQKSYCQTKKYTCRGGPMWPPVT